MTRARSLSSWLRCANCTRDLNPIADDVLGCSSGHRFDLNRRGYIALLGGRSPVTGDTAPMLDAREAVLESGAYRPIADAVDAVAPAGPTGRMIDVATGTGHYLERLLASRPGWRALALDRSPTAVARAIRRTSADGLVADIWRDWPVRDGIADALVGVFAPRNPAEFHRVLAPGGALVIAVPGPDHLTELHAAGLTLSVSPDKASSLIDDLWPWFEHDQSREVGYPLAVTPQLVADLVGMGPAAHHARKAEPPTATLSTVTVDVTVLRFRRRRRAPLQG